MATAPKSNTAPKANSALRLWGPGLVLLVLFYVITPWLLPPACPTHITVATGSKEGNYFAVANRYREILARDHITLDVRNTAGTVENLRLLNDPSSGVTLGIVQGGVATEDDATRLEALGSLYLEPLWIFHRVPNPAGDPGASTPLIVDHLNQLRDKRVAIDAEGSGTRPVAELLFNESGVPKDAATWSPLGGKKAAEALLAGEIDAACFVISPKSAIVKDLLLAREIGLVNFSQARALTKRHRFLSLVTLPAGVVDPGRNLPASETYLVAPTATLVARRDLHPALVTLLLRAAKEVHGSGGWLEEPGEFPSPLHTGIPLGSDAKRYFDSGPSILYRYLPFSIAAWLDRTKVMLLPLLTLLFPALRAAPPIYRWRIRSKIYKWYAVLRDIDQRQRDGVKGDYAADIARLQQVEDELSEVTVPLSYMEEFYNLRLHAAFVLNQLKADHVPPTTASTGHPLFTRPGVSSGIV